MEGEVGIDTGEDHVEATREAAKMGMGSLPLKQERSGSDEGPWRPTKLFKMNNNEFDNAFSSSSSPSPPPPPHHHHPQASLLMRSGSIVSGEDGQTMLCFSKSQEASLPYRVSAAAAEDTSSNQDFSLFQTHPPPFYTKGSVSARYHEGGGYGGFSRFRGPFTPSQWMELEHQSLIYKHLAANIPVPSNLLIPIKRSLNPYAFSSLSSGSYIANSFGLGPFHLGFSGNSDPEPGRCRRTDGKKWRCSRDAVPDQKYCERHINRGRHRSRKPVEGQTGHAVSGSTTSKVAPFASSSSSASAVSSSSSASNSRHQFITSSQPAAANPSAEHLVTRIHDPEGLSMIPPTMNLSSKDSSTLLAQKQHVAFKDSSTHSTFGLVSSDSLLNLSQRGLFVNSRNSDSLQGFSGQETQHQHSLCHFVDKWPKEQPRRTSGIWPEELKSSDWTQLSMSIPMASSDLSSSSNSPQEKKLTISPLPLAGKFDPTGMSGGHTQDEPLQKQTHWLPVSWGNSMGGPLGEVLNGTSNNAGGSKYSSSLNLATEEWNSSPQLRSSPTGVLQKSSFISLSNSSSGSSPRGGEHHEAPKAANFCNDLLGSTLASSLGIPLHVKLFRGDPSRGRSSHK